MQKQRTDLCEFYGLSWYILFPLLYKPTITAILFKPCIKVLSVTNIGQYERNDVYCWNESAKIDKNLAKGMKCYCYDVVIVLFGNFPSDHVSFVFEFLKFLERNNVNDSFYLLLGLLTSNTLTHNFAILMYCCIIALVFLVNTLKSGHEKSRDC